MDNNTFLNFTTNYEPIVWYKREEEIVPGTD